MGEYYRSHHEDEFEYASDSPDQGAFGVGGDRASVGPWTPEAPSVRTEEDLEAPGAGEDPCPDQDPGGPAESLGEKDAIYGESVEANGKTDPFGDRPHKPIAQYTSREVGDEGERLAVAYLRRRGYEILACNWRCDAGEIDIIATEGTGEVVLVEVKTRLDLGAAKDAMPELSVDRRKQRRYRKLALCYLLAHPEVEMVRFDVIAVSIVAERCARLRHLIGAFAWDES